MNQSCNHHLEIISDSFDEGSPLPGATIEHLATCAECRVFREAWEDGSGFLAEDASFSKHLETPISLAEIVVSQSLGNARSLRRSTIPWFSVAAVAAAFALVAGLVLWKPGENSPNAALNPVPSVDQSADPSSHPDHVASSPDSSERIGLSLKIPELDPQVVEARLEAAVIAEADSLAETGHRLGRLAADLRRQTAALSSYIPNVN